MPFLSLPQKDLQKILNICNQISPKKSDIDVFTYTKFHVAEGKVTFSALSAHAYYTSALNLSNSDPISQPLTFLAKSDLLASSVGMIHDDIVGLDINLDKHTLIVQGSKSKHTLRVTTDKISDFIEPHEKPDELQVKLSLPVSEFVEANRVAFTTVGLPKNVYQSEFLNICFTVLPQEKKVAVVSCDKFRISKTYIEAVIEHTGPEIESKTNFLVLPKGLQLLSANLDGVEKVELNFEKSMVWVHFSDHSLVLRYGEGTYPDYDKIIPQSFTCTFQLNTKDARESLKQVYLTARSNVINKSVSMNIDSEKKKVTFVSTSTDGSGSEASVDLLKYEGVPEPWSQTFNADYLLDYINNVDSENVFFEANPGKPMVMSPENEKSRQLCLVQGLR